MRKESLLLIALLLIAGCPQLKGILGGEEQKVKLRIKWLGQAGFMIENNNKRLYVDPFTIPSNSLKGDAILVTHGDFDHCDQASINQLLKNDAIVFTSADCGTRLLWVNNLIIVKPGNNYTLGSVHIETVDAYSTRDSQHAKGLGVGYIITIEGIRIYHAGDTEVIPEMGSFGHIDVAILPISNEEHSMSPSEAAVAARLLNANYTVPMQYSSNQEARDFASSISDLDVEILSNKDLIFYEE